MAWQLICRDKYSTIVTRMEYQNQHLHKISIMCYEHFCEMGSSVPIIVSTDKI